MKKLFIAFIALAITGFLIGGCSSYVGTRDDYFGYDNHPRTSKPVKIVKRTTEEIVTLKDDDEEEESENWSNPLSKEKRSETESYDDDSKIVINNVYYGGLYTPAIDPWWYWYNDWVFWHRPLIGFSWGFYWGYTWRPLWAGCHPYYGFYYDPIAAAYSPWGGYYLWSDPYYSPFYPYYGWRYNTVRQEKRYRRFGPGRGYADKASGFDQYRERAKAARSGNRQAAALIGGREARAESSRRYVKRYENYGKDYIAVRKPVSNSARKSVSRSSLRKVYAETVQKYTGNNPYTRRYDFGGKSSLGKSNFSRRQSFDGNSEYRSLKRANVRAKARSYGRKPSFTPRVSRPSYGGGTSIKRNFSAPRSSRSSSGSSYRSGGSSRSSGRAGGSRGSRRAR